MTEVLAVFRSRAQAIDCNSRLRSLGVACNLMNTPKEAGVGCGLSIKIAQRMLPRAKKIIAAGNYSAFYGYYTMYSQYGRTYFGRQ